MQHNEFTMRSIGRSAYTFAKGLVSPQMSASMFFLDFVVYPPLVLFSILWGLHTLGHQSIWLALALVPAGLFSWTFVEYLAHRFVLHKVPGIAELHQAHHDETLELIGTPTLLSVLVFFVAAFLPMSFVIGSTLTWFWFAGMMSGFVLYTAVHYAVHHFSSGGYRIMKQLKWQHNVHHHGTGSFNYGVTTVFWDHVFGTYSDKMRDSH